MEKKICFRYKEESFSIRRDKLYVLSRFIEEYFQQDEIIIENNENKDVDLSVFVAFLSYGIVPYTEEKQNVLIRMLNDWKCHHSMIETIKFKKQMKSMNTIIFRNGKEYEINKELMLLNSRVYSSYHSNHQNEQLTTQDDYSDEAFLAFLECVNGKISVPNENMALEVLNIASKWDCPDICYAIREHFDEISILLNEEIDSSKSENIISKNFPKYLTDDRFTNLPLPMIIRIINNTNHIFSLNEYSIFLEKGCIIHGNSFLVVLSFLNVKKSNDLGEWGRITNNIFQNHSNSFLSNIIESFLENLSNINEQQREIENLKLKINEISHQNSMLLNIISKESILIDPAEAKTIVNIRKEFLSNLSFFKQRWNPNFEESFKRNYTQAVIYCLMKDTFYKLSENGFLEAIQHKSYDMMRFICSQYGIDISRYWSYVLDTFDLRMIEIMVDSHASIYEYGGILSRERFCLKGINTQNDESNDDNFQKQLLRVFSKKWDNILYPTCQFSRSFLSVLIHERLFNSFLHTYCLWEPLILQNVSVSLCFM